MTGQDSPAADDRSSHAPKRKAYQKPELQVYGDLAKMTNTNFGSKSNDGGGAVNMHFTS